MMMFGLKPLGLKATASMYLGKGMVGTDFFLTSKASYQYRTHKFPPISMPKDSLLIYKSSIAPCKRDNLSHIQNSLLVVNFNN